MDFTPSLHLSVLDFDEKINFRQTTTVNQQDWNTVILLLFLSLNQVYIAPNI